MLRTETLQHCPICRGTSLRRLLVAPDYESHSGVYGIDECGECTTAFTNPRPVEDELPKLYEKRHGPPRKNTYGEGLFAVHIGPTLQLVRERPGLQIDSVEPRYWPKLRFIVDIPGLREVATWNCVIRVRKRLS